MAIQLLSVGNLIRRAFRLDLRFLPGLCLMYSLFPVLLSGQAGPGGGSSGNERLLFGPVEGFTTAAHEVPDGLVLPSRTIVPFSVHGFSGDGAGPGETDDFIQWSRRGLVRADGPLAWYSFSKVGSAWIQCTLPDGHRLDCPLDVRSLDPGDLQFFAVAAPEPAFDMPPEDAENDQTVEAWKNPVSMASVQRTTEGFATGCAIRQRIVLQANTPQVGEGDLASLLEWRKDGHAIGLREVRLDVSWNPTDQLLVLGPPRHEMPVLIRYYRVLIESLFEGDIPEDEPVSFLATTDPPGLESFVTWLSATMNGSAEPTLGSGALFTTTFKNTFDFDEAAGGLTQWIGVRADNSTRSQEGEKCKGGFPTLKINTAGVDLTNFTTPECPGNEPPLIGNKKVCYGALGNQNVGTTEASSKVNVQLVGTDNACCKCCQVGFIQNLLIQGTFQADYDGGGKIKITIGQDKDGDGDEDECKLPLLDAPEPNNNDPWYTVPQGPVSGKNCGQAFDVIMKDLPATCFPLCVGEEPTQKLIKIVDSKKFVTWLVRECPKGSGNYNYEYYWEWTVTHSYIIENNDCTNATVKAGFVGCATTTANGVGQGTNVPVINGCKPIECAKTTPCF